VRTLTTTGGEAQTIASGHTRPTTRDTAASDASTSASVVDQLQTEIRIAALSWKVVPV
jgi:hypothetical protein